MPRIGMSKCHGYGSQNTMSRGSIYHGYGDRYTMDRGVDIPWVGDLIYPG